MPNSTDIGWFKQQFGQQIQNAIAGSPFGLDMIVAVACQETGEIWSILRHSGLPVASIVKLCVGDTIDYKGPGKGRQAFPRNRDALLAQPQGGAMFAIARAALEDMAAYVPGYQGAVANPNKFCHGYGVFQRDLQFFLEDPSYFLDRRYEDFGQSLDHCLRELRRGLRKLDLDHRTALSDVEFASVAIAYNTGRYNPAKGLKQGFFDGEKYYGERIFDFVRRSREAGDPGQSLALGRHVVIARDGLKLCGGPDIHFASARTLATGSELSVVSRSADKAWAQVDLEGDGLVDGYVFAAFIVPAVGNGPGEDMSDWVAARNN